MPVCLAGTKLANIRLEICFALRICAAPPFPEEGFDILHVAAAGNVFDGLFVNGHDGRAENGLPALSVA